MAVITPPRPPEEHPDYRALMQAIVNLRQVLTGSFSGMTSWRDRDSYSARLADYEKRSKALKDALDVDYKRDLELYNQYVKEEQEKVLKRIEDEKRMLEESKKKNSSPIGSLGI